jgi:hypothetical protein
MSDFSTLTRSAHGSRRNAVRLILTISACLAFLASATAKADPIMGTITLTVAPALPTVDGAGGGIPSPAVYTSGLVNLGALPQNFALAGPALGFVGGIIEESVQTTFDMRITFDGAAGSQPYVDVTGSLGGGVESLPGSAASNFFGTPTSATLRDWTIGSGVPLALLDQYLNLSNYQQLTQGFGGTAPPDTGTFWLVMDPAPSNAPEPASLLVYAIALAALGGRRGARALVAVDASRNVDYFEYSNGSWARYTG